MKTIVNLVTFRILLIFFRTFLGVGVLNSAIFKLIRMLEWKTKHFPFNLQSGLTLSNFRDVGSGFELRNQIRHCKTVCIKRTPYLINYNPMRTQWTTNGNRDAGSSYLCDRGLHRHLRNFGGVWTPQTPLGTPLSGPEGSRKLRFPDFMTTAQDGGKVVSLRHRPPLPPENTPGTHSC